MSLRINSIRIVLDEAPHLMEFLFSHKSAELREKTETLLMQASEEFDRNEELLIRSAMDIWNGSGGLLLNEILDELDSDTLIQLVSGILRLRELEWEWM